MRKPTIVTAIILALALFSGSVWAQSPSPATGDSTEPVKSLEDLVFPIAELGECSNAGSCMSYCEDPVNHAACLDYAKKKGFYKDDPILAPTDEFWKDTQGTLGCNSVESCTNFCSDSTNHAKCDDFAKDQDMVGGYVQQADKPEFLEKAKEVLGCDSAQTCANFCDSAENRTKCGQFADSVGLLGGETRQGPGGCGSTGTCQSFCSDPNNFSVCNNFARGGETPFRGPGGCDSPESCRSHCEQNPRECRSYSPGSNGVYVPVNCPDGQYFGPGGVCTSNEKTKEAGQCSQSGGFWEGDRCIEEGNIPIGIHPRVGGAYFQPRADMGNCKTPGECYDYCKENPGKCGGFQLGSGRPKDDYIPSLYYTPGSEVKFAPKPEMGNCDSPGGCYDYCKENPGKCQGFDSKAPKPSDTYMPGTYYTPPTDYTYFTPSATSFYVTPMYYTPPAGSNYTTPTYYTPGTYSTPSYYTPPSGSNYTTPTYYTPGQYYPTPSGGQYPTPSYITPMYYSPPAGSNYTTPIYYTPAAYVTPTYYTPPAGSNYTTPSYNTPPAYSTPTYYTPYNNGANYTTPTYYTPPAGTNYNTPWYPTPTYYSPSNTGGSGGYSYPSPTYSSPSYVYPSPSGTGVNYYTPNSSYTYPSPTDGYSTPSSSNPYPAPPNYVTPAYNSPSYATPAYNTPAYETPSYGTPAEYPTPPVQGASTEKDWWQIFLDFLRERL